MKASRSPRRRSRRRPEGVQVPRVADAVRAPRAVRARIPAKAALNRAGDRLAAGLHLWKPVKLCQPDRGLDVAHVQLEPGLRDFVAVGAARFVAAPGVAAEAVQRERRIRSATRRPRRSASRPRRW